MFHNFKKITTVGVSIALTTTLVMPMSALALSVPQEPAAVAADETRLPDVTVKRAIVVTMDGETLYAVNANEKAKIASMTKIMTALIASEYKEKATNNGKNDITITVSSEAAKTMGSTSSLQSGDKVKLSELMEGMMIPSGNDAAYAIAYGIGALMLNDEGNATPTETDALARFVKAMNDKAAVLGMNDTIFANPCGLDDEGYEGEHCSTASDVVKMTIAAYQRNDVKEICGEKSATMDVTRGNSNVSITLTSTNSLLATRDDAKGMKTGFTDAAGACFAGVFVDKDGRECVSVVMGDTNRESVLADTAVLWNWEENAQETKTLLDGMEKVDEGVSIGRVGVPTWTDKTVGVAVSGDLTYKDWYWENETTANVEMSIPNEGTIEKGQTIGKVTFTHSDGVIIMERDVVATEAVAEPNFFEEIGINLIRFFSFATGAQKQATDALLI